MKEKKAYWELLQDPKWQKMRLKIMERDSFRCQECEDETTTLNVHHTYYEKGKMPWEYPEESLRCLCKTCHEQADALRVALQRQIGRLERYQIEILLGFARGLEVAEYPHVEQEANCYEEVEGLVRGFIGNSGVNKTVNRYINSTIARLAESHAHAIDGYKLLEVIEGIDKGDSGA